MITFTTSAGVASTYDQAVTSTTRRERDKRMYRSPFGSTWRTEGSGDRLPERVTVTVEAHGSTAESDVDTIISDAEGAASLSTPYWTATLEGVVNAVVTPVSTGYRVRVEALTREPSEHVDTLVTQGGDAITTQGGATLAAS